MMKLPLKYKINAIILVILIPMLIFSIHHYFSMLGHDKEHLKSRNMDISSDMAKELDELIDRSFDLLRALSKHPAVRNGDGAGSDRLFSELLPEYPVYLNFLAADMDGYNRGSGFFSTDVRRLNYLDREWFKQAAAGRQVVGNLHVSKLFNVPTVMIALPVPGEAGEQTGVIGIPVNLEKVKDNFLSSWRLPEKAEITVIDAKGNVLIDTLGQETIGKNVKDIAYLNRVLSRQMETGEETGRDGVKRLYVFSSLSRAGWKVIVGIPALEAYHHTFMMSRNYIIMLFVVFAFALLLSMSIGRRVTGNIESLKEGLKEIGRGNMSFALRLRGNDELNEVAASFNQMVTERLNAEKRVKESESFLLSVLEGIGEGVVVIGRDFRIISANSGYCRQVKTDCGEIIGRFCYEVSHHISEPCYEKEHSCACAVKQCFETGEHHREIHVHYDKNGTPIYVEVNAYPLRNESGEIASAIETLIDVTDTVLLEKRLEEVKERYKKLYDDAPDLMHSIDRDGNVIICNMTMARALGYEPEQIMGQPVMKIIAPESVRACMSKLDFIAENGFCEGELNFLMKDGRRMPVIVKAKAVYDDEGNFLMIDSVSRDITENKALESQLLHAQKMEAVGRFAGGISHDFNNILTAIIGYGNLISMRMEKDDQLRTYVKQILDSAERASNLTQSLLAFSRKQIMNTRPVDINEIIGRVQKLLLRVIGEDVELKTLLADGKLTVLADSGQIEQVLMNLAINARDAMPKGGALTVGTKLVTTDEEFLKVHAYGKAGRYALISVADTGVGMDDKTRERMFEPFFTTKEIGKGTGLGLSIIYGIVKQHNGHIDVRSEPGKGTIFHIYLPLAETEFQEIKADGLSFFTGGTEVVLIAEDDPEVRKLTRDVLEGFGYRVIEATDGEDAVLKFRENKDRIDLLIIDIIMPKRNGKEVLEEVRKERPGIRALFTSGYTLDIIQKQEILEQGLHFMPKPVSPVELLKKVREVLS